VHAHWLQTERTTRFFGTEIGGIPDRRPGVEALGSKEDFGGRRSLAQIQALESGVGEERSRSSAAGLRGADERYDQPLRWATAWT
jgi:hypothetical protein